MNQLEFQEKTISDQCKLFYLVAGEASGDILGEGLINELKQHFPAARFKGIGGPLMAKAGLEVVYPMDRLSVMGVIPILRRLLELVGVRRRLIKTIVEEQADCFIGIDAPVFNTQLEYKLKSKGINTVHYVSPSVWAWRENRIYKIVKSVSLMICLFPFELDIYKRHQLPAVSVGHPLADEIDLDPDVLGAKEKLGLSNKEKLVAILPGSRGSEMNFLLPPFFASATILAKQYPKLSFVMPCANLKRRAQVESFIKDNDINLDIQLFDGRSREVMQASDIVLLASGTATLEAMLLKKPMLVCYKVSAFSFWIYAKFLKIKNFSLPNLLAKKNLVKELIQDNCSVENIVTEMERLIHCDDRDALINEYTQLHQSLRLGGSQKAASAIVALLEGLKIE